MENIKIKTSFKEFTVTELLAYQNDELSKSDNSTERIISLIKFSCNMNDEEYKQITVKERGNIIDAISKLNGWDKDFQKSNATNEEKEVKE